MISQAIYTCNRLGFWTMKLTTPERLLKMMDELRLTEQKQLCELSGASKSTVHQWFKGTIKSISPEYAYQFEEKTGFSARWLMLGEGPPRLSKAILHTVEVMKTMEPEKQYLVARLADQVSQPKEGTNGTQ